MNALSFTLPGEPLPKGDRIARNGHVVITKSTARVKRWEESLGWTVRAALGGVALSYTGPIMIEASFYFAPPRKLPADRLGFPCVRPDVDKCLRALLDALSGVVYRDDGQIVDVVARKRYSDRPRVDVTVTPWRNYGD